jgi:hypothetical protein
VSGFQSLYEPIAREAAKQAGIDECIFIALITRESHWDPAVISTDGARGIAQIMPWAHPHVNPNDPKEALFYSARLIRAYLDRHGGDYPLALASYNVGGPRVSSWTSVPKWEMDAYVTPILNLAEQGCTRTPVEIPTLAVSSTVVLDTPTPTSPLIGTPTPTPPSFVTQTPGPEPIFLAAIFLAFIFRMK